MRFFARNPVIEQLAETIAEATDQRESLSERAAVALRVFKATTDKRGDAVRDDYAKGDHAIHGLRRRT